jgi:hypothetical protein
LEPQPTRVPFSGKLPNAPAVTVPVIVSPSTVASLVNVIGIGTVMLTDQVSVLPLTLPSLISVDPIAPAWVPVQVSPLLFTVSVAFWSPIGDFTTVS